MKSSFWQRHPQLTDIISVLMFILAVIIGTLVIHSFVFQSYTVVGQSMENTLHNGERILVNRLPVTWSNLQNKQYKPERGEIIVFENPQYTSGMAERFIVKRVIAFEGETVKVKDGVLTVYNSEHPNGFNPDKELEDGNKPKDFTSHDGEWKVPTGELFVAGDNREGNHSYDSRAGLGTIPLYNVIGPAGVRIFPFNKLKIF